MTNNNNFYDKAQNIQIQQHSVSSTQHLVNNEDFDYEKAKNIINQINKYNEEFISIYGESATKVQGTIENITQLILEKEEPTKIKKLFGTIKELTIGISGSLIASGIIQLINTIL